MQVQANKVVTFHYRLSEPGQPIIEDSRDLQPVVYLQGHKGMFQAVEDAMEGKSAGDTFSITLTPEQAYGQRQDDAIQRVSINHVITRGGKKTKFKPGMVVQLNTREGPRDVVVVKAGLKTLDVDTNHPLAGKTLNFDIEVVDVRDASEEELSHGHAHGPGGHQH